ncbi:MAG TPA: MBL fold metallo-hydrolase [Solirubrobacteraceae bacterium]|nr:MBL fold metallo-hydrolase [Solirubrobacteraceae bacterium]
MRESAQGAKPFGIAVDPGPDFLDNLYRCGYSLADIHMVVLTHDHADHIASLDALLALMGIRMILGDKTFNRHERLTIVGNESVVGRYEFFNVAHPVKRNELGEYDARRDAVKVMSFDDFYELSKLRGKARKERKEADQVFLEPTSLRIEPVRTVDHYDATGYVAQGFLLSMGYGKDRSSVLFTGDTGPAPAAGGEGVGRHYYASGAKRLKDAAASADVVIAHLSSVPLRELRELAALTSSDDHAAGEFSKLWAQAVEQTKAAEGDESLAKGAAATEFLLQQLQFAFRSLSAKSDRDLSVSPLSPLELIKEQPEKHLYLSGLLELAEHMAQTASPGQAPLLLIGELREELGTFRTRIASHITKAVFDSPGGEPALTPGIALTADIGLRVRLSRPAADRSRDARRHLEGERRALGASVLCTTCDLDNDLVATERFHAPRQIREVCVKGENEGVFYNCLLHDPGKQPEQPWVESVERFDVFGD